MSIEILFSLSIALLPIQNFGLDIGVMTLKPSQVLFLCYFFLSLAMKGLVLTRLQKIAAGFFTLLVLLFLLSSVSAVSPEKSVILTIAVLLCSLFFLSACNYLNTTENALERMKSVLYWSCSAYSIYGILQLILFFIGYNANVNFEAWDVIPRVPYFSSENVHAAFVLLTLSLLFGDIVFSNKKSILGIMFVFIINLAGLVATGTRGAMLAFATVAAIQMLWAYLNSNINLKRIFFILTPAIALILFFWDILFLRFDSLYEGGDGTADVRVEHYKIMYDFFVEKPLLGLGLGGSQALGYQDIHNVFLMVLYEGGIFSFVTYCLLAALPFLHFCCLFRIRADIASRLNTFIILMLSFSAVLIQSLFEPSLYFYHLYLALALGLFAVRVDAKTNGASLKNYYAD